MKAVKAWEANTDRTKTTTASERNPKRTAESAPVFASWRIPRCEIINKTKRKPELTDGAADPVRRTEGGSLAVQIVIVLPSVSVALNDGADLDLLELRFEVFESEDGLPHAGAADGQAVLVGIDHGNHVVIPHEVLPRGRVEVLPELLYPSLRVVRESGVGEEVGRRGRIVVVRVLEDGAVGDDLGVGLGQPADVVLAHYLVDVAAVVLHVDFPVDA